VSRSTLVVHAFGGSPGADQSGPPLVGFAVSRAVGPAVTRNRVKRRLRHLVRERLPELPEGCRLVVRATPAAASASFDELRSDLAATLDRVQRKAAP
jgi:ribonuclease P protein component